MTDTATGALKVAYFVPPSRHFAGIERVTHEIASGLAEAHPRLLDVSVIWASGYDEPMLRDTPYRSHVLHVERLRALGAALRRCVSAHGFDVLVVPQVEASVVAWAATQGLRGTVLVPHLHGNPRIEYAEGTARTRAAFAVFRSVVTRRVPAVLAVSPSLRDYAARTVARRTRTVFVKNPVRQLGPVDHVPSEDGRFRFVSVARLSRQKGQDILLRAIAVARHRLPPFEVTLVGTGDAQPSLTGLAAELGIEDVVTFAGYSSDPVQQLRQADCFVLASRWEGFGVAIVEALQCGVPVLATDCEFGPADVLTEPGLGILAAPDDADALAEGLIRATTEFERGDEADARRRAAAAAYSTSAAVASHFSVLQAVRP